MKVLISTGLLFALASFAIAQPAAPEIASPLAAERSRIELDRKRAEERFGLEEAACYQRFAVNDCLRNVRVRRRAAMEDLQRQEIALKDEERKLRAAEQLERTDEKASAKSSQEEADKREVARREYQERLERAEQKKADRQKEAEQKTGAMPRERPASGNVLSEDSKAMEKKAFEDKQREAVERKVQRDKALSEKTGKPASTLPLRP